MLYLTVPTNTGNIFWRLKLITFMKVMALYMLWPYIWGYDCHILRVNELKGVILISKNNLVHLTIRGSSHTQLFEITVDCIWGEGEFYAKRNNFHQFFI